MYATPAAPRKDQVSRMAQALDEELDPWRNRSIEQPYPYLVVDVRYEYVPEITTATTTFEVLTHDAVLPEMNMQGFYPECEGTKIHTILDTTVS